MNRFLIATTLLLTTACGTESPPTRMDIVEPISRAWCEKLQFCIGSDHTVDQCTSHTVYHLCEYDDTCEDPVTDTQYSQAWDCLNEIDLMECYPVYFGQVPSVCLDSLHPTE